MNANVIDSLQKPLPLTAYTLLIIYLLIQLITAATSAPSDTYRNVNDDIIKRLLEVQEQNARSLTTLSENSRQQTMILSQLNSSLSLAVDRQVTKDKFDRSIQELKKQ